ncbi:hypothetical protein C8J56DRAFT_1163786 [Mycena floridula]|nr:hypothetical protein C8J56DRAFT_1163786 [Mycena floridula]
MLFRLEFRVSGSNTTEKSCRLLLTMDVRRKDLRTEPIMTSIVSMPVQLLMAWRIMIVTQTRVWTWIIVVISLVSFGASIATTVYVELKPAFSQFPSFRASPVTWLVSSAVADVLITGVLVYSLHEKKSGFNTSLDVYVNHIIRLTIQTGALTALFTLSDALVFVAVKDTTIYFAWDLSLSKLYLSTILSSLNARDTWRNGANALYPSDLDELPEFHAPIRFRAPPNSEIELVQLAEPSEDVVTSCKQRRSSRASSSQLKASE